MIDADIRKLQVREIFWFLDKYRLSGFMAIKDGVNKYMGNYADLYEFFFFEVGFMYAMLLEELLRYAVL